MYIPVVTPVTPLDYSILFNSLTENDINTIKHLKKPTPKMLELFLKKLHLSNSKIDDTILSTYVYKKPVTDIKEKIPSDLKHKILMERNVFQKNI